VYISPNPVADFVGDSLKSCPQLKTKFTDLSSVTINGVPTGSITNWNWSFGNNNSSSSTTPPQQTYTNSSPTQSAYYTVSLTVTTADGCVNVKTKNNYIQVYPRPIADFGWGPVGADIDAPTIDFVNQSIGASGYPANHPVVYGTYGVEYYLGDVFAMNQNSNNVYTNAGFSHTYEHYDPYTYYVTQWVINSMGCKDSITKPVEILPNFTFYIPNAFSPNGDGTNEGFKGTGVGIDNTTYNLWVFDRWGMMIFYADDLEKSWDGHMKGSSDKPVLQEDVYVWKVKFSDFRGKKHEYHGTVTLLK
jgi:gliding motility-associated-like protein